MIVLGLCDGQIAWRLTVWGHVPWSLRPNSRPPAAVVDRWRNRCHCCYAMMRSWCRCVASVSCQTIAINEGKIHKTFKASDHTHRRTLGSHSPVCWNSWWPAMICDSPPTAVHHSTRNYATVSNDSSHMTKAQLVMAPVRAMWAVDLVWAPPYH